MELPADLALIKELVSTGDYNCQRPAVSNKLLSIKQLSLWFNAITEMLSRFPDPEAFLFVTTASLNTGSESQIRTQQVKLEYNTMKLEQVPPSSKLPALTREEMRLFGKTEIMASRDLQNLVAPTLFTPSVEARTLLSRSQQFKSPEYQETIILDEHTGLTLVSDQRKFVFPSEQRITSVRAVTFHYVCEARNDANKKAGINTVRAHSVMADQYKDNGIVSEEEAFWPTHHVNVLCVQRTGADSPTALWGNCPPLAGAGSDADSNAFIIPLKPDSLVIATEGSNNCLSPSALWGNYPPVADAGSNADSNAFILPLESDSLVIDAEGSRNCQ